MSYQDLEFLPNYDHLSADRWQPKQIFAKYHGYKKQDKVDPENSNITFEQILNLSCLPFWWDTPDPSSPEFRKHIEMANKTGGRCCFSHYVGLPQKKGKTLPWFRYQLHAAHKLEQTKAEVIWKAAGLGFTTFMQHYLPCRSLQSSNLEMAHTTIPILTGKNVGIAKDFIKGIKQIFRQRLGIEFYTNEKEIQFPYPNNVLMRAYPSNQDVEAARGLKKVFYSYTDECDFYSKLSSRLVLDINERYIGKSGARVMLVSTPNKPGHILDLIGREFGHLYHIMKLDWRYGFGLIYDIEDIRRAMTFPSWLREYCLQFLGGGGNVYLPSDLKWAYLLGDLIRKQFPNPDDICAPIFPKGIGVDPGWSSSAFGITITALRDGLLEVVYHEEIEKAKLSEMLNKLMKLFYKYKNSKVFIDASQPSFIGELKDKLKDRKAFEQFGYIDTFDTLQHVRGGMRNLGPDRMKGEEFIKHRMRMKDIFNRRVVPVDFGSMREALLESNSTMVRRGVIRIPRQFEKLCIGLEGAITKSGTDWNLDKDETPYDDSVDSFCLSTIPFNFDVNHAKYVLEDTHKRNALYKQLISMTVT